MNGEGDDDGLGRGVGSGVDGVGAGVARDDEFGLFVFGVNDPGTTEGSSCWAMGGSNDGIDGSNRKGANEGTSDAPGNDDGLTTTGTCVVGLGDSDVVGMLVLVAVGVWPWDEGLS